MIDNYNRLVLIVSLALIGLSVLFSLETYYSDISNSESATLLRLEGIAQSVALQIDGDKHEALTQKYTKIGAINSNNQDSSYLILHKMLQKNAVATMLNTPIYTLILDSVSNEFYFIVTSADTPYFRHPYPTFPTQLKQKYTKGGIIPIFSDMLGTWLSAFSPILNSKNKQVGIIMIDEKFDDFIMSAQKAALMHLLFALILSLPIIGLLIWWVRNVLQRESQLKKKIKQSLDENVAINLALENSYDQLSKVETQRKEMIANISHDLRTPITSILGYVETVLMRGKNLVGFQNLRGLGETANHDSSTILATQDKQFLESSLREGEKLKKLISDLFELSRLETPQLKINKERFSLSEILQDTFMGYEKKFSDNNIKPNLEIPGNKPFFINADMQLIHRLLQNLFDNAIKHNSPLNSTKFINAKLSEVNNAIVCTIENSSAHLTPENLENIFNRYFTLASETGGTGLGLSIVKKICDVHDADIKVTHKNGVTSFTFELSNS